MKRSVMSDEAIYGLMARTWIFTRDCHVPPAGGTRNDRIKVKLKIMDKDLIKIYKDEIDFLLQLKESIGRLNNRIHDKLALITIEKFKLKFSKLDFKYLNAGASGIDIQGYDKKHKKRFLVAEVKTNILSTSSLRGPQKKAIEKDLKRLAQIDSKFRFLVVLSDKTKEAIKKQLNTEKNYPEIDIINALNYK